MGEFLLPGTVGPVVALNRAVAVSMAHGPERGLAIVDSLVERAELDGYYLLHSTRAELLHRLGRNGEAAMDSSAQASSQRTMLIAATSPAGVLKSMVEIVLQFDYK